MVYFDYTAKKFPLTPDQRANYAPAAEDGRVMLQGPVLALKHLQWFLKSHLLLYVFLIGKTVLYNLFF